MGQSRFCIQFFCPTPSIVNRLLFCVNDFLNRKRNRKVEKGNRPVAAQWWLPITWKGKLKWWSESCGNSHFKPWADLRVWGGYMYTGQQHINKDLSDFTSTAFFRIAFCKIQRFLIFCSFLPPKKPNWQRKNHRKILSLVQFLSSRGFLRTPGDPAGRLERGGTARQLGTAGYPKKFKQKKKSISIWLGFFQAKYGDKIPKNHPKKPFLDVFDPIFQNLWLVWWFAPKKKLLS